LCKKIGTIGRLIHQTNKEDEGGSPMITAHSLNVAKFIIQKAKSPVSNLKLQKLLYYVQGWHLGIYGEPVFSQPIQAWIHGPVVPYVFGKFKEYKWISIPPDPTTVVLTQNLETHVVKVLNAYQHLTAAQLEAISHKEAPWLEARKGLAPTQPSTAEITHASMKRYFGRKLNG
jgi:uncharacterized phage-associated protein